MAGASFAPCAVIPVYDHEQAVGRVVQGVRAAGLPCFLVDDGSAERCARALRDIVAATPEAALLRLDPNRGKGGAVIAGFAAAAARGYTHALQVDADGQHALEDIPRFVAEARAHPEALICGRPLFDASMPRVRRYGRYLTHFMVWLNTLSFDIPDSLCGFRLYPLAPALRLIAEEHVGARMEFDAEILVRLYWRQLPLRWIPTRVIYPLDGVSHFRLVHDNARMVALQTRLLCGMLWRLPLLLRRKLT